MCLDYDSYIACPLVVVFLIKSQSWLTFSIDSRLCEIVKFVLDVPIGFSRFLVSPPVYPCLFFPPLLINTPALYQPRQPCLIPRPVTCSPFPH